jgi:hypothetical protein
MTVVLRDSIQTKPLPIANAIIHRRLTRLVTELKRSKFLASQHFAIEWTWWTQQGLVAIGSIAKPEVAMRVHIPSLVIRT